MATRFEPGPEQCDVRRASDAVSPFDDDQLAGIFFLFDAGKRRSV